MPSKSKAQHNLMAMVANDPKAAKRLGIPQSVGRDYVKADKGHKFGSGGSMKESKAMMRKEVAFMKKKGAPKSMIRHEEEEMRGGRGKKVRRFDVGGPSRVVGPPRGRGAKPGPGSMAFLREGPGPQDYYSVFGMKIPKGYSDQKQRIEAQHKGIPYDPRVNWMPKPPSREEAIKYFPNPDYDPAYDPKLAAQAEAFKKSQPKGRKKPTVTVEEIKETPAPSRGGGGGGAPPMAPRGMGPFMPMMPMMPEKRGKVTVEEVEESKGQGKYRGGKINSHKASKGPFRHAADGVAHKGKTKGRVVKMREGGMAYSEGGSVYRKGADGIASKGKTKGKMVKMVKMRYGGEC